MAAVLRPTGGVTIELATHFNQYADILANTFDLDNTTQGAVRKFILPVGVADPASPEIGRIWWRSNLGVAGRLHIRDGASQNVPYLPIRQRVEAASAIVFTSSATSYTDITNATVTLTTTGGRVRLELLPQTGQAQCIVGANGFPAVPVSLLLAQIKALSDANSMGEHYVENFHDSAHLVALAVPVSSFVWDYKPAAGAHTFKLQGLVGSAAVNLAISGCILVATEYGD